MTHSKSWANLTDLQEGFLGGQLLTSSTKLWNPELYDPLDVSSSDYTALYELLEDEITHEETLSLELFGETAFERFIGCFIISIMPDEGLQETLCSLRDILET